MTIPNSLSKRPHFHVVRNDQNGNATFSDELDTLKEAQNLERTMREYTPQDTLRGLGATPIFGTWIKRHGYDTAHYNPPEPQAQASADQSATR